MKSTFLITFEGNYADEFDWTERYLRELETDQAENFLRVVKELKASRINTPIYMGIGTNEDIEYRNIRQFLEDVTIEVVSGTDAEVLKRYAEKLDIKINSSYDIYTKILEYYEEYNRSYTVTELITALKAYDGKTRVMIKAYDEETEEDTISPLTGLSESCDENGPTLELTF